MTAWHWLIVGTCVFWVISLGAVYVYRDEQGTLQARLGMLPFLLYLLMPVIVALSVRYVPMAERPTVTERIKDADTTRTGRVD